MDDMISRQPIRPDLLALNVLGAVLLRDSARRNLDHLSILETFGISVDRCLVLLLGLGYALWGNA